MNVKLAAAKLGVGHRKAKVNLVTMIRVASSQFSFYEKKHCDKVN